MKYKGLVAVGLIVFMVVIMIATNPDEDAFFRHVRRYLSRHRNKDESKIIQLFGSMTDEAIYLSIKLGTKRKKFLFFSIFRFPNINKQFGQKVIGLGPGIYFPIN